MVYIPKNKVQTNLYAAAKEYYYDVSFITEYVGYYYKLSNGKTFTGNSPGSDVNSVEIYKAADIESDSGANILVNPLSNHPLFPTERDYIRGYFTRYFSKRRNQNIYTELTKQEFDAYSKQSPSPTSTNITPNFRIINVLPEATQYWLLYKTFSLTWMLTGEIEKTYKLNLEMVKMIEEKNQLLGFSIYLKEDYLKYYKA